MLAKSQLVTLVPIRNMDRAVKFYTKTLGGKLLMRATGEMRDGWASVKVGGDELWLIVPSKRERRSAAYSTFVVKDIRKVVKGLLRRRVKFDAAERMPGSKAEGPIAVAPWGSSAFFHDTEGNLLMLWQNA